MSLPCGSVRSPVLSRVHRITRILLPALVCVGLGSICRQGLGFAGAKPLQNTLSASRGCEASKLRSGVALGPGKIKSERDWWVLTEEYGNQLDKSIKAVKAMQGVRGFNQRDFYAAKQKDIAPNKMALGWVSEAISTWKPSDFYTVPPASLSLSAVKEVKTYQTTEERSVVSPAQVPAYHRPRVGLRLEQELGPKRPPRDLDGYEKYVKGRSTLSKVVPELASSVASSKDFVVDRSGLVTLLRYLDESLTPHLKKSGQLGAPSSVGLPVDLVKISKAPGMKGLIIEDIFKNADLRAGMEYRGTWRRKEMSNHGSYYPAFQRMIHGETSKVTYSSTGLKQVTGSRGGFQPEYFRLVEFNLGGFSFLSRAKTHATRDGENVETFNRNWYEAQTVGLLDTYYKFLLGGVENYVLGFHRHGLIHEVEERKLQDLVDKQPQVVEVAEKRFGRLVKLLAEVKDKTQSGDGPWVLQFQKGKLVLGEYKKENFVQLIPELEPEGVMELA